MSWSSPPIRWVPGIEHRSSGLVASSHTHWAISKALTCTFNIIFNCKNNTYSQFKINKLRNEWRRGGETLKQYRRARIQMGVSIHHPRLPWENCVCVCVCFQIFLCNRKHLGCSPERLTTSYVFLSFHVSTLSSVFPELVVYDRVVRFPLASHNHKHSQ